MDKQTKCSSQTKSLSFSNGEWSLSTVAVMFSESGKKSSTGAVDSMKSSSKICYEFLCSVLFFSNN